VLAICCALASVPTFVWTDTDALSAPKHFVLVSTQRHALAFTRNVVGHNEPLPSTFPVVKSAPAPEILLVFMHHKLRSDHISRWGQAHEQSSTTEGGVFKHLKTALSSAKSSVHIPHTVVDSTLFNTAAFHGHDVHEVTPSNVNATLEKLHGLNHYGNGKTEVILLRFEEPDVWNPKSLPQKYRQDDALMGHVLTSVRQATKGSYVAMFTANEVVPLKAEMSVLLSTPAQVFFATEFTRQWPDYWSPIAWVTIIVSAIPIVILFCAVNCLLNVQAPDRFLEPKAD